MIENEDVKIDSIGDVESKLRNLLESLYETTSLYSFEEILSQYSSILNGQLNILFYMRERARFDRISRVQIDDGYLVFEYMSFEIKDGIAERFVGDLERLRMRAEKLVSKGYQNFGSNLSCLICDTGSIYYKESVINLTKRIFTAFYKNCGGSEHFISNVANRYTKEYFNKNPTLETDSLINYIEKSTGITTIIGEKTYSGPLEQRRHPRELVNLIHSQSIDPGILLNDSQFCRDLKTALSRKIQTFGKIEDLDLFYVIKVFSDNLTITSDFTNQTPYRAKERALAIYISRRDRIRLDDVHCANHLVLSALTARRDRERERIIWALDDRLFAIEESLLRNPKPTFSDLVELTISVIDEIFVYSINEFSLEQIILRVHTKASNSEPDYLKLTKQWVSGDQSRVADTIDDNVYITSSDHLSIRSFVSGAFSSFESIDSIVAAIEDLEGRLDAAIDPSLVRADRSKAGFSSGVNPSQDTNPLLIKLEVMRAALSDRQRLVITPKSTSASVASCPVIVGRTVMGTLDLIGSDDRRLAEDRVFLNQLAHKLGESIRRIQLANDQGWLRRMSFIHAARHRIESIIRRAAEKIGESIQDELTEIFTRETRALEKIDESQKQKFTLRAILARHPGVHFSDDEIKFVDSEVQEFLENSEFADFYEEVIEDVFDTIFSNRSHGPVSGDSVIVEYHREADNNELLEIGYCADSYVPTAALELMGVSPIRDRSSPTYHYGLFLLGVQVRMAGGILRTLPPDPTFSQSKFGLSILLGG